MFPLGSSHPLAKRYRRILSSSLCHLSSLFDKFPTKSLHPHVLVPQGFSRSFYSLIIIRSLNDHPVSLSSADLLIITRSPIHRSAPTPHLVSFSFQRSPVLSTVMLFLQPVSHSFNRSSIPSTVLQFLPPFSYSFHPIPRMSPIPPNVYKISYIPPRDFCSSQGPFSFRRLLFLPKSPILPRSLIPLQVSPIY